MSRSRNPSRFFRSAAGRARSTAISMSMARTASSSTPGRRSWSHGGEHANRDGQSLFVAGDGALRRDHSPARVRELRPGNESQADHRLRSAGHSLLPGRGVCDRGRDRHPPGPFPLGPGLRPHVTCRSTEVNFSPEAILSLIATAFTLIAFLLMLEESIALRVGRDPMSNGVRSFVRRFPRVTYALAVVIGMVLGHLLWPWTPL